MHSAWKGTGLQARLFRSSGLVASGYFASQAIRLGSNLILTRILFPEAFGLMALITVFLVGLTMLSDVGISPSIQQSARGDESEFLDTAWTIQVGRGVLLWVLSCLLGSFAAWLYDEPRLELMLPVAGLSLLISGFNPTRIITASRHLALGRVTLLDLLSQAISLTLMILLAIAIKDVWALVVGAVLASFVRLIFMRQLLPGPQNRFYWDNSAATELIRFGKWIFFSTLCGFVLAQGDKAILGKYLSLEMLGIYNIGYFLAGFPQAVSSQVMAQVMIPLHRECPPKSSSSNYAKVRKTRFLMTLVVLVFQCSVAFVGVWLVNFLYDDRFTTAGSIVVAVACMGMPYLIGMTYDYAALGQGDSRGVFYLLLGKAVMQTFLFFFGMQYYGLSGAFVGLWLSQIFMHPFVVSLARRHGAWDPLHDVVYTLLGAVLTVAVLQFHWDALSQLQFFTEDQ